MHPTGLMRTKIYLFYAFCNTPLWSMVLFITTPILVTGDSVTVYNHAIGPCNLFQKYNLFNHNRSYFVCISIDRYPIPSHYRHINICTRIVMANEMRETHNMHIKILLSL